MCRACALTQLFTTKAQIISAVFLLPLLALLGYALKVQYDTAWQERQSATRQHVEIAHSLLGWAWAQEQAGMPREQAQTLAQAVARTGRVGSAGPVSVCSRTCSTSMRSSTKRRAAWHAPSTPGAMSRPRRCWARARPFPRFRWR